MYYNIIYNASFTSQAKAKPSALVLDHLVPCISLALF